jgi:hypothetical protein
MSIGMKAHQADISTTMLVEKENGTWVLQISSSLTAFQHEIRTHFAETPYETPEEFQQMVIEHIKNNLQLSFNDSQNITLGKGDVRLGHETKVVFQVFGIPSDIKSVLVKNTVFDAIHRSQSALVLLKEGFNKEQFVLNDANNHTVELQVNGNEFAEVEENNTSLISAGLLLIVIAGIAALLLLMNSRPIKNSGLTVVSLKN